MIALDWLGWPVGSPAVHRMSVKLARDVEPPCLRVVGCSIYFGFVRASEEALCAAMVEELHSVVVLFVGMGFGTSRRRDR